MATTFKRLPPQRGVHSSSPDTDPHLAFAACPWSPDPQTANQMVVQAIPCAACQAGCWGTHQTVGWAGLRRHLPLSQPQATAGGALQPQHPLLSQPGAEVARCHHLPCQASAAAALRCCPLPGQPLASAGAPRPCLLPGQAQPAAQRCCLLLSQLQPRAEAAHHQVGAAGQAAGAAAGSRLTGLHWARPGVQFDPLADGRQLQRSQAAAALSSAVLLGNCQHHQQLAGNGPADAAGGRHAPILAYAVLPCQQPLPLLVAAAEHWPPALQIGAVNFCEGLLPLAAAAVCCQAASPACPVPRRQLQRPLLAFAAAAAQEDVHNPPHPVWPAYCCG